MLIIKTLMQLFSTPYPDHSKIDILNVLVLLFYSKYQLLFEMNAASEIILQCVMRTITGFQYFYLSLEDEDEEGRYNYLVWSYNILQQLLLYFLNKTEDTKNTVTISQIVCQLFDILLNIWKFNYNYTPPTVFDYKIGIFIY